jgi:hypothetical protein
MIGIGYELGSNRPTGDNPFGLRPRLLTHEGREAFWSNLHELASSGSIGSVVLHRLYGEARARDYFDFDARRQIEQHHDPKYTDYAKHMTREVIRFARDYPDLRIDLYFGSLRQFNMAFLVSPQSTPEMRGEWMDRFWHELEVARGLIAEGCNIRMVFDHASSYEPDRPEWYALYHLSRMHPGRVVIETVPKRDTPQASLPALAFEDNYRFIERTDPDRASHADLTRVTHGEPDGGIVAFVRDCMDKGHTPVVADTELNQSGMTPRQVFAEASAGRPQGGVE